MYHLLVNSHGWEPPAASIDLDRVFQWTAESLENQFRSEGQLLASELIKYPALFATEQGGSGHQEARVGFFEEIREMNREVRFRFFFLEGMPAVSLHELIELKTALDIEDRELTRTHWSIKDIDLFRALFRRSLHSAVNPSVFSIEDLPRVERRVVSLMMPFDSAFDDVHDKIREVCEAKRLNCQRADNIWRHDDVMQDVVSLICRSKVVICDCTGKNPNVFYEAGIAHTLGKDVILITQNRDDIPFDLRALRNVEYQNNAVGREKLAEILGSRLADLTGA